MITFAKKAEPQVAPDGSGENRFEQVRQAAKERGRKSDADGTRLRARPSAGGNQLIWGTDALPEQAASDEIY